MSFHAPHSVGGTNGDEQDTVFIIFYCSSICVNKTEKDLQHKKHGPVHNQQGHTQQTETQTMGRIYVSLTLAYTTQRNINTYIHSTQ